MIARLQFRWTVVPWFRPRLRVPPVPGEALRIERVIAGARLLLTLVAFMQLDRTQPFPREYIFQAEVFLIAFAVHGLTAMAVLRTRQRTTRAFALTTHAIDLVTAVAMLPVAAPPSPFFVFFLFMLAAAAFRWGLRETFATNLVAVALVFIHAVLTAWWPQLNFGIPYDLDRILLRTAYLSMIGLCLGYFAEESRLLRSETVAIAGILGRVRADAGATRVLTAIAAEVQTLFNAKNLLLAVENRSTQRAFRWDSTTGWRTAPAMMPTDALGADEYRFLFGSPNETLALTRKFWRRMSPLAYFITRLDPQGRRGDVHEVLLPVAFVTAYPYRRIISVPVTFSDEWNGRVFVFDPTVNVRLVALAEFLQKLIRQVAPAVLSVYLLAELRSRAGAMERARVARELHDGVIQSLIGVEMRLEALRHQASLSGTKTGEELLRLQQMVRDEVLNLRDLMTQMRSPELDPNELLDYLAQLVDRFGRDSGITARFFSDLKEVALSRQVCFELVRIVQEGLVNVRRHSGATIVVVRFGRTDGQWVLEIDDNGQGFPFAGTMSLDQLDEGRKGPIVIKDRVRAIGGQLTLESMPHRGTRLKVLVPQEAYV
jgi:signal transduction histidine kinase